MALRAKLDVDNVYWGPEEVAKLAPGDVPVPDEVIRPGAYRWVLPDATHPQARWEPLPPNQVKKAEMAPSLEQAFAELAAHLAASDTKAALPPRVQAWLDNYNQTIDALGAK